MSTGYGMIHCLSNKQNMNAKFSSEAELIGTSEYVPFNVWMVTFLEAKRYKIFFSSIIRAPQGWQRMTGLPV